MSAFRRGRPVRWIVVVVAALLAGWAPAVRTVQAAGAANGSLWSKAAPGNDLLSDHRAKAPGDLLTIIIVEKAEANQKASSSNKKEAGVSAGPGLGFLSFFPEIKAKGGDNLTASGTTTRGGSLSAKMTVVVSEVLPNGNLVVEGVQAITVNKEHQTIKLRGQVRPEDISRDNTVLSTFVANAEIIYLGDGVVGDKQKPGILSRIFSWLF
ncbi:MAG: flagellar basal body L-ring protein FlgH [Bacillota bacterium]|nr:flagellar basal body L-ring protein FlgH [Bacillota bacterium]